MARFVGQIDLLSSKNQIKIFLDKNYFVCIIQRNNNNFHLKGVINLAVTNAQRIDGCKKKIRLGIESVLNDGFSENDLGFKESQINNVVDNLFRMKHLMQGAKK